VKELQVAAPVLGVRLLTLNASSESDFADVFTTLAQQRAGGLVTMGDTLFEALIGQLIALPLVMQSPRFMRRAGLWWLAG
jgi:hypothetical protein